MVTTQHVAGVVMDHINGMQEAAKGFMVLSQIIEERAEKMSQTDAEGIAILCRSLARFMESDHMEAGEEIEQLGKMAAPAKLRAA